MHKPYQTIHIYKTKLQNWKLQLLPIQGHEIVGNLCPLFLERLSRCVGKSWYPWDTTFPFLGIWSQLLYHVFPSINWPSPAKYVCLDKTSNLWAISEIAKVVTGKEMRKQSMEKISEIRSVCFTKFFWCLEYSKKSEKIKHFFKKWLSFQARLFWNLRILLKPLNFLHNL